jgi:hypothetical protein
LGSAVDATVLRWLEIAIEYYDALPAATRQQIDVRDSKLGDASPVLAVSPPSGVPSLGSQGRAPRQLITRHPSAMVGGMLCTVVQPRRSS